MTNLANAQTDEVLNNNNNTTAHATQQPTTPHNQPQPSKPSEKALWQQLLSHKYQQQEQPTSNTTDKKSDTNISTKAENTHLKAETNRPHKSIVPLKPEKTQTNIKSNNVTPVQTSNQTKDTNDSKPQKLPASNKEKTDTSEEAQTTEKEDQYVDNPTKEELQADIESFRDDDNLLFDRYRIHSRNGVADSPSRIFDIKNYALFFENNIPIIIDYYKNVLILSSEDLSEVLSIDSSTTKQMTFEMKNHLKTTVHLNLINYMLSQDAQTWLNELDDSTINYVPNYNGPKESIWFSWIWGGIALGLSLLLIITYVIYRIVVWARSEEYSATPTTNTEQGTNYIIPSTDDLYSEVYASKDSLIQDKNPYGGVDIFMDRRIEE